MKTITLLSVLSIVLLQFGACKSKKSATTTASNTTQQPIVPSPPPITAAPMPAEEVYRLVVEFYSIGAGVDNKTREDFDKFIGSYPKKIAYETTHWGREGELDYCLKLSELSTGEQADFVKKATEMLSSSKLVHINEHAKCVHKH